MITGGGLGTALVHRRVFERIAPSRPVYTHRSAPICNFFAEAITDGGYVGEDFAFGQRWRDTGGEIWALLDADTIHDGETGHFGREIWDRREALALARDQVAADYATAAAERAELYSAIDRAKARGVDTTGADEGFVNPVPAMGTPYRGWQFTDLAKASATSTKYSEIARSRRDQLNSMSPGDSHDPS